MDTFKLDAVRDKTDSTWVYSRGWMYNFCGVKEIPCDSLEHGIKILKEIGYIKSCPLEIAFRAIDDLKDRSPKIAEDTVNRHEVKDVIRILVRDMERGIL